MNELPFELCKKHKTDTKSSWRRKGLITNNFDEIYNKYIYATHCELCNKQFPNTKDRQMDHNHETGEFRNIVCQICNLKKADVKIQSNNTSGYTGIYKYYDKRYKQGYIWAFSVSINGKLKTIKSSTDFDYLKDFAEKWKKENNYYT